MPKRRVPDIVSQRQRFGEIFIQAEGARDRAGNLHNLKRVRETRAVVIAFVIDENRVLWARRRNAVEWMIRSQSRRKAFRPALAGSA